MNLKGKIEQITNIGVRPQYQPWEIYLTRKINLITLIGIFNVALGFTLMLVIKNYDFIRECIFIFIATPFVIVLNFYKNYKWAIHAFCAIGYFFYFFINVRMGLESLMILNFFPFFITVIQLLGRKEMVKHLVIILTLCLVTLTFIFIGFEHDYLLVKISGTNLTYIKYINIFISFMVTMTFNVSTLSESIKQENLIKGMLKEKEILLAEVFHRVKNNMNIVASLLNLKKNSSNSTEVKDALEECRNRIYSMALVHQKIYKTENFAKLSLEEYLQDLMNALIDSQGNANSVEVLIVCDEINLNLAQAVPFGLIVNELITNSFKYAQVSERKLKISMEIKQQLNTISVVVRDNGPGIETSEGDKNSLGMELIKSLSDQLDASYNFKNENGTVFYLTFTN